MIEGYNPDDCGMISAADLFSKESVEKMLAECKSRYSLLADFENVTNYFDQLKILKAFYLHNEPEIIAEAKQNKHRFWISYPIDWTRLFTPIERSAWNAIRAKGRIVLYPQYPVLNYHLDFGNPYLKIALELDGKAYHDQEKDMIRDQALANIGWAVIRIPGSEMENTHFKDFADCYDADDSDDDTRCHVNRWLLYTGDGVIEAIKRIYFMPSPLESEKDWWFYETCLETIKKHRLVKQILNPIISKHEALHRH